MAAGVGRQRCSHGGKQARLWWGGRAGQCRLSHSPPPGKGSERGVGAQPPAHPGGGDAGHFGGAPFRPLPPTAIAWPV